MGLPGLDFSSVIILLSDTYNIQPQTHATLSTGPEIIRFRYLFIPKHHPVTDSTTTPSFKKRARPRPVRGSALIVRQK